MSASRICATSHVLGRAQREQIAALEIDAEIAIATHNESRRARDQQGQRKHRGEESFAEEVDMFRRDQVEHRDALDLVGVDKPAEKIPPDNQRSKERSEDAERERDRETFDRPARLPKQNRRRDQRGDVGVEDRAKRFFVGGLERRFSMISRAPILPADVHK